MHVRSRIVAAAVTAGLLVASVAVVPSAEATGLPFTPDPVNSTATLTFYDAAGARVTSGSVSAAPFATYVASSADLRTGSDTKATLYGYLPKNGVDTGAWSGEQLTASTSYPVAAVGSVPTTLPVTTLGVGDITLAALLADFPNTAVDGYQGLYQLRLRTSGGSGGGVSTHYAEADILVTGTTWSQVYPNFLTATTTTIATSVASPITAGTPLTLTSTSTTGVAGSVTFTDGGTALAAAVAVDTTTGQATLTFSPTGGGHSFAADFAPSDGAHSGSSSAPLAFTVDKTTATAALTVPATARFGTGVNATISVSGSAGTPTGTVQVREGATVLASGTLVNGAVTLKLPASLAVKAHSLTAAYAGNSTYLAATSAAKPVTVLRAISTVTAKLSKVKIRRTVHGVLTVKVTAPGVVPTGTITVKWGSKKLVAKVLARGVAVLTLPLLAKGTYKLVALYSGSAFVLPRASAVVTLTVTA
jgi:hypothetical protein